MKFINFNKNKNIKTLKAWRMQYLQDIDNKITSLYDYLMWDNPEYYLFNDTTRQDSTTLDETYCQTVNFNEKHVPLFFASKLNYHQGFCNSHNKGDGLLGIHVSFQIKTPIYSSSVKEVICQISDSHTIDDVYNYNEETKQLTNTKDYGWSSSQSIDWEGEKLSGFNYYKCTLSNSKAAQIKTLLLICNFANGYVCFLNKKPFDINNAHSIIKQSPSSYLISPVGNGGFYNFKPNDDHLVAIYEDNDLQQFVNTIYTNLTYNSRYINPESSSKKFNANNTLLSVPCIKDTKSHIVDKDGNMWTGGKELQTMLVSNTGEQIFADVCTHTYTSVVDNQQIFNIEAYQLENSRFSILDTQWLFY